MDLFRGQRQGDLYESGASQGYKKKPCLKKQREGGRGNERDRCEDWTWISQASSLFCSFFNNINLGGWHTKKQVSSWHPRKCHYSLFSSIPLRLTHSWKICHGKGNWERTGKQEVSLGGARGRNWGWVYSKHWKKFSKIKDTTMSHIFLPYVKSKLIHLCTYIDILHICDMKVEGNYGRETMDKVVRR